MLKPKQPRKNNYIVALAYAQN